MTPSYPLRITGMLWIALTCTETMASVAITSLTTDRARYRPGEAARITAVLQAADDPSCPVTFGIRYQDRDMDIFHETAFFTNHTARISVDWKTPDRDFTGYAVTLECGDPTNEPAYAFTAIDVSSDWSRFPRYGYLADFESMPEERVDHVISRLSSFHLNGLQFYDWQWKHHRPVPGSPEAPAESWVDIANRPVSRTTITDYIRAARHAGMTAMNYNLLFGALDGYEQDGVDPAWALYKTPDGTDPDVHPLPTGWLSDSIHLMNPADPDWQRYIIARENEVNRMLDFDGWHIDQLGGRGTLYTRVGKPVELAATYAPFLRQARAGMNTRLVMNAVGAYGLSEIAQTDGLDFLYVEIWPWDGCRHYGYLKEIIERGWSESGHRYNTVLAAYMNYGLNDRGQFNLPGVLMADAVIFSSGGAHLELGDHGLLCSEYFPNRRLVMSAELESRLHTYYSFSVAYQNWLRDPCVRPLPRTVRSKTPGVECSGSDTPGRLWYYVRQHGADEILHLINLTAHRHNAWRDDRGDQPAPVRISPFSLVYFTDSPVAAVLTASPDDPRGQLIPVDFKPVSENGQLGWLITLPSIDYWQMVVIRTGDQDVTNGL